MAVGLAQNGMEVLAIDDNPNTVEAIRNQVTQAVCFKIEDETSLRAMGIEEMDTVVVSMGESFAQAIIITALLKKILISPTLLHVLATRFTKIFSSLLALIKSLCPSVIVACVWQTA